MNKLEEPLNIDERYLYEINIRLNILIDQFSSFLETYANKEELTVTSEKRSTVKPEIQKVEKSEATEASVIDLNNDSIPTVSNKKTKKATKK